MEWKRNLRFCRIRGDSLSSLLTPTVRISGIESPDDSRPPRHKLFRQRLGSSHVHYKNSAPERLPRDGVGLAINSAVSRSQDQLHIHIACVHSDVLEALNKNQDKIGTPGLFHAALFPSLLPCQMGVWAKISRQ